MSASATTGIPPGTLRILIVDDETIVRDSLAAWFRQDGHQVDVAEGGKEALRLVSANRYDMAFLDIKMPGMDGLELQSRLAAADPELSIVLMTAYASVETAVKAMKNGAYDYIVKPFDPDDLSMLVKRAAEHRSLRAENIRLKKSLDRRPPPRRSSAPRPRCSTSSTSWPRCPPRTRPCSSPASRAPARRSWPGPSTPPRRGATTRWWSSTAGPCPRASSRASSSATRRAPSPARARGTRASSSRPRGARSSSTRSAR